VRQCFIGISTHSAHGRSRSSAVKIVQIKVDLDMKAKTIRTGNQRLGANKGAASMVLGQIR
jgi:hypothetical protein